MRRPAACEREFVVGVKVSNVHHVSPCIVASPAGARARGRRANLPLSATTMLTFLAYEPPLHHFHDLLVLVARQ